MSLNIYIAHPDKSYLFIFSLPLPFPQICVWCWHHIMEMAQKDETESRCPACRSPYDKERIVTMAANCQRLFSSC